jgi:hypothetical protein
MTQVCETSLREKAVEAFAKHEEERRREEATYQARVRKDRADWLIHRLENIGITVPEFTGDTVMIDGLTFGLRFTDPRFPGHLVLISTCDCGAELVSKPINTLADIGRWLSGGHIQPCACQQEKKQTPTPELTTAEQLESLIRQIAREEMSAGWE